MFKKILRFCLFSTAGLTAIIIIWAILGNLIAARKEKPIEAAKEEFKKEFPIKTETNKSALKLEELTSKLGVYISLSLEQTSTRSLHISGYKQTELSDFKFQQEMREYINNQVENNNDKIDILPAKLQKFLNSHTKLLAEIENHILNSELPEWELNDVSNNNYLDSLPSFLNFTKLQNLLLLNILDKTRQGKYQEAEKSLEVSWKLNQVLQKRPELISQLVVLIVTKPQTAIMRKMPNLRPIWQDRLQQDITYNLPQAFLNAFTLEEFVLSNTAKKVPLSSYIKDIIMIEKDVIGISPPPDFYAVISYFLSLKKQGYRIPTMYYMKSFYLMKNSTDNSYDYNYNIIYTSLLDVILKPIFRLSVTEGWYINQEAFRHLRQHNICSFNQEEMVKKDQLASQWWKVNELFAISWISQWKKMLKTSLDMELTQKIIQVQEIAQKQGSWPKQVSGIESSSVCQDAKWIYQVDDNGTMSIELKDKFPWLSNRKDELPLKYSVKYPRK